MFAKERKILEAVADGEDDPVVDSEDLIPSVNDFGLRVRDVFAEVKFKGRMLL